MDYFVQIKNDIVLQTLWNELDTFVKDICTKCGRDSSHGYEHMKTVAHNAMKIVSLEKHENEKEVLPMIITCAWLHDVCDYKYSTEVGPNKDLSLVENIKLSMKSSEPTPSNKTSMIIFLLKHFSINEIETVCKILDRVSFSTEMKSIKENPTWCDDMSANEKFILDVVRDADRLEAIGRIGLTRCIEYSRHTYLKKNSREIPRHELITGVKKHADEKLLHIASKYIRTVSGKKLAEPLHLEFVQALTEFVGEK